jgi:hypothetical protein
MDLIIYFDKNMMSALKEDVFHSAGNPHAIGLVEFCFVMIKNILKYWNRDPLDQNLIGMLCQIYDCIDIDSRGVIDWEDFVSFVLRSGRNQFKAISGYSNIEYIQRTDAPIVVPLRQLYFCFELQTLFSFDGDLPVIRIFRLNNPFIP